MLSRPVGDVTRPPRLVGRESMPIRTGMHSRPGKHPEAWRAVEGRESIAPNDVGRK
jgi:hypothetical protein